MNIPIDVMVIGAGPAALAISSELCNQGLRVEGLAPNNPMTPWNNTYGIWGLEVDQYNFSALLSHRWSNCNSYFNALPVKHGTDYGLFDKNLLQSHWLDSIQRSGMVWHKGEATVLQHFEQYSLIVTKDGVSFKARLVVEATGHQPRFIRRSTSTSIAYQTAYGIVGRFSKTPIQSGQFILMDYRNHDRLIGGSDKQKSDPTFLYAMDLGEGIYFLEETSLSSTAPVPYVKLQDRLYRRLAEDGIAVLEICHEEFCLFPMNLPLPSFEQQVVGFGAAASMVHPASGYMMGSLIRRAPLLAQSISSNLRNSSFSSEKIAYEAWNSLWPKDSVRCHLIFQFGLEKLMRFSEPQLLDFFDTFFQLPLPQWSGFLTNTLSIGQLIGAMINLFFKAPWNVRKGLIEIKGNEANLILKAIFFPMK